MGYRSGRGKGPADPYDISVAWGSGVLGMNATPPVSSQLHDQDVPPTNCAVGFSGLDLEAVLGNAYFDAHVGQVGLDIGGAHGNFARHSMQGVACVEGKACGRSGDTPAAVEAVLRIKTEMPSVIGVAAGSSSAGSSSLAVVSSALKVSPTGAASGGDQDIIVS